MRYEDFEVRIDMAGEDGYLVQVLGSPAGQASDLLGRLDPGILAVCPGGDPGLPSTAAAGRRDLAGAAGTAAAGLTLRAIGTALFAALFNGAVRDLYNQSLGIVSTRPGHGLRLKLHFSLARPGLARLASLPWELLYREDTNEFLSLNRQTPVVRYLEIPQPVQPLSLAPPLRVLVVVASPDDLPRLDLDQELSKLREALAGRPRLELHLLAGKPERATKRAFGDALLSQRFQVIHFMGHGAWEETTGRGQLVFESAAGRSDPITGEELAVYLRQAPSVRLAFLNGCNTARVTRCGGLDPFAGVATALVRGGLPAVVAMQLAVSDAAAIHFSAAFYRRIATSVAVDTAVTEARIALYSDRPDSADWGAPVLFMRSGDGKLFDLSSIPLDEKREAERLVAACDGDQLDSFDRSLAAAARGRHEGSIRPGNNLERAQRGIDHASLQGGEAWLQLSEALLACLSPLPPFAAALQGDNPRPPGEVWRIESGEVLGSGADAGAPGAIPAATLPPDLAGRSNLPWQGLRFRDGVLSARLWWPNVGGGGLLLRHAPARGALLGLLRLEDGGAAMAELWQQEGGSLVPLGAAPLPRLSPDGWYEVVLRLAGRRASWRVGATAVSGQLAADIAPGHAGLVKTGGSTIRFRNVRLTVHRRDEHALPPEPWR
jgi:hypothetical protein